MTGADHSSEITHTKPISPVLQIAAVVWVIFLYYGIQLLTQAWAVYPHLDLPEQWTQHGNWVQTIDHHIWQMLLALVLIFILSRGRLERWGLNLHNAGESLRLLWKFIKIVGLYLIGVGFLIQLFFYPRPEAEFPITVANVTGRLLFMGLISGLSEEILFRGFMQTFLYRFFKGLYRWGPVEIPVAGLITAIIFSLVHINFRFFPFEITHLSIPQLLLAFGLGLYYAYAYHQTRSLLNPILAHNFVNGALYLSQLLLVLLPFNFSFSLG